jgi:hypothetical protein
MADCLERHWGTRFAVFTAVNDTHSSATERAEDTKWPDRCGPDCRVLFQLPSHSSA